jgi:CHASE3 domain sensor protein
MSSRLIRILLVVFAIALGFAASYFLKVVGSKLTSNLAAADGLRDQATILIGSLANVRASQVAYVARGQGDAFWMARVSKLLPTLDQQMADFSAALTAPAAQADLELATAAVENFHKLDARVRDYVRGDNSLPASDLIFSDGLESVGTATTQIEAALRDELQAREANVAALRKRALLVLGGGAGGILLVLLILAFTGGVSKAPATEITPQPVQPAELPDRSMTRKLSSAARLCTDLGRVLETRQLPGLLERTAKVIDASGMIVWIADPTGHELRPAMSFGYSEQVMARMGGIARDANNAAAASYRSAEMRTVSSDGFTNGALVAPLITPDGCIGVLSAEMKGGSERDEAAQALAAIFAAQLATLVSAPAAAHARTAAQA